MDKGLFTAYAGASTPADLEQLEAMHRAAPGDRDLLDWLAFSHYSAGSNRRALELYGILAGLAPEEASFHYYLGNLHFRLGDAAAARKAWSTCLASPDGPEFEDRVRPRLGLPDPGPAGP